jgi:hypothetical protein
MSKKTILSFLIISMFMISTINACSVGCDTCGTANAVAPEDCATCKTAAGYFQIAGKTADIACYPRTAPPDQYYFDIPTSLFKPCSANCQQCSDAGTSATDQKCNTCITNYAIVGNTGNCNKQGDVVAGYFWNTNKWTNCHAGCDSCNSAGNDTGYDCITCSAGFIKLVIGVNSNCYKKTSPPAGYFYKTEGDTAFTACGTNCATCTQVASGNNQNCVTCITPDTFKLFTNDGSNTCVDKAAPPTNYTWNATTNIWDFSGTCYTSCKTCSKAGDATSNGCLTCKAGYYPLSDDSTKCSQTSPGAYYFDSGKLQWGKCDTSCATCSNGTTCDTCATNMFTDPYQKFCVATCPDGTYKDKTTNRCRPCTFPCKTCNLSQDTCLSCATADFNLNPNTGKCDAKCYTGVDNKFKDNAGTCGTCPANCAKCTNAFTCQTCTSGSILFQDNCISACPMGFYPKDNNGVKTCVLCNSACAACTDDSIKCSTCAPGLFRKSDVTCVVSCDAGLTPDNAGNCKSCLELGNFKYQDNCVTSCPTGLFPNNGVCMNCKDSGRYLYNNNCVSQCPHGYIFSANNVCYFENKVGDYVNIINENSDILECDPQPCRNGGTCLTDRTNSQTFNYCQCTTGFYGRRCEYNYNSGQPNTNISIKNFSWIYKSPDVLTEDLYKYLKDSLFASLNNTMSINNLSDLDYNLLDLTDVAMYSNYYRSTKNSTGIADYSSNVAEIKKNLEAYIKAILTTSDVVKSNILTNKYIEYNNQNVNLAIYTTNAMQQTRLLQDQQTQNTYVDFTNCETKIRADNPQIQSSQPIIVTKFEYGKNSLPSDIRIKQVTSDYSIKIQFYNSVTKEALSANACTGTNAIIYNLPIHTTPNIDIEKYHYDKEDNFEPFDRTQTAYATRCFQKFDRSTGADTTINYRRQQIWQKLNAVCTAGCIYQGIDASNYFKCACNAVDIEVFYWFDEFIFDKLRMVNLDVVTCPHIAFTRPAIHKNPGFYVGLLINIFFILFVFFFCIFRKNVIKGDTTSLYYYDYKNKEDPNRDSPYEFVKPKQNVELKNKVKDLEKREIAKGNLAEEPERPQIVITADSILLEEKNDGKQVTLFTSSKKGETGLKAKARDVPKDSGSPPDAKKIRITIRDIESYSPAEALTKGVDQRSACQWFRDYLADRTFFSLFAKTSILIPFWVRFSYMLFFWSILWTLNAMMFSDEYIEKRINIPQQKRVIYY